MSKIEIVISIVLGCYFIKLSLDIVSSLLDLRLQILKDRIEIQHKKEENIYSGFGFDFVQIRDGYIIPAKIKGTEEKVYITCIHHNDKHVFLNKGIYVLWEDLEPVE